jgi:hypothetical protein
LIVFALRKSALKKLTWQCSSADKAPMRPQGTKLQLEVRRRVAVSLLEAGWGISEISVVQG